MSSPASHANPRIVWRYQDEKHMSNDQRVLMAYWQWRHKLKNYPLPVRYPVGYPRPPRCLGVIVSDTPTSVPNIISLAQGRVNVYLKSYINALKNQPEFQKLKSRVESGENLLISELDVAQQDTLPYFKEKYNVSDDFIVDNVMDVTQENIKIVLNDPKTPFGYGYCIALCLLGKEKEWTN